MSVSGDSLILAHNGQDSPGGPVVRVLSLSALRNGDRNAPNFRYMKEAIGGGTAVPVTMMVSLAGYAFLVKPGRNLTIFTFPNLPATSQAPPLISASITLGEQHGMMRAGALFRAGKLYFSTARKVADESGSQPPRYSVRVIRIPVQKAGNTLQAGKDQSKGFPDWFFGRNATSDAPSDLVSYEHSSMGVNKNGGMFNGRRPRPPVTQASACVGNFGVSPRGALAGPAPQEPGPICSGVRHRAPGTRKPPSPVSRLRLELSQRHGGQFIHDPVDAHTPRARKHPQSQVFAFRNSSRPSPPRHHQIPIRLQPFH
jgi:hypothetical protein